MNPLYLLHSLIVRAYRFSIWSHRATSHQLQATEDTIMSAISEFAAKQAASNARIGAAISGITGDVTNLSAQIAALQASSGVLTVEDQALLDGIQAQGEALVAKLEALDAITAPVVLTEPAALANPEE